MPNVTTRGRGEGKWKGEGGDLGFTKHVVQLRPTKLTVPYSHEMQTRMSVESKTLVWPHPGE